MTRDGDPRFRFRLATRAVLFSIAGLVIAGVVGRRFIYNFGIPFPVLSLTGGLVLLLVALRAVLDQFSGPPAPRTNPVARGTRIGDYAPRLSHDHHSLRHRYIHYPCRCRGRRPQDERRSRGNGGRGTRHRLAGDAFRPHNPALDGTILQIFGVILGVTQAALGLRIMLVALSDIGVFSIRVQACAHAHALRRNRRAARPRGADTAGNRLVAGRSASQSADRPARRSQDAHEAETCTGEPRSRPRVNLAN